MNNSFDFMTLTAGLYVVISRNFSRKSRVKIDFKLKSRVKIKYETGQSLTAVTGGSIEDRGVTPPCTMVKLSPM